MEQWSLQGLARMNRYHGSHVTRRMPHHEVAALLAILHETGFLERPNNLFCSQRGKTRHAAKVWLGAYRHGDRDDSLEDPRLFARFSCGRPL